ncbi:hypothetical protein [Streptomyces sp. NPDC059979]|uniref:hypothetical protein n=1 Tax=Streptomyces sp. NPDC059979 TaxID=3347021 RepID=UPI00367ECB5D
MRCFVLDSNAIEPIADNPGAYEATRAAIDTGKIKLLITHVNIDELAAIPDLGRRSLLLLLLCDLGTLVQLVPQSSSTPGSTSAASTTTKRSTTPATP